MAIFCLSNSLEDLKERLGKIVVGYTRDQKPVLARDLQTHGAMTVLLKTDQAESRTDPGEQSRVHPRRSLRQHRPWLQFGDRHEGGDEAGRYVVTKRASAPTWARRKFIDIKCASPGCPLGRGDSSQTVRA